MPSILGLPMTPRDLARFPVDVAAAIIAVPRELAELRDAIRALTADLAAAHLEDPDEPYVAPATPARGPLDVFARATATTRRPA